MSDEGEKNEIGSVSLGEAFNAIEPPVSFFFLYTCRTSPAKRFDVDNGMSESFQIQEAGSKEA